MIFIPQRWTLKKIYFKVDNVLLKLRAESSRRLKCPSASSLSTASLPAAMSALGVIDHCQQHHCPAWAWPWAPLSWTLTTCGLTGQRGLHSLVSTGSLSSHEAGSDPGYPTGLTPLRVLSLASGWCQQRRTHGQGCPRPSQPALPLQWDCGKTHGW